MNMTEILNKKGREVVSVQSGTSLKDIAKVLSTHNIGAVVVKAEGESICGIVSERDIIHHIADGGLASLEDPVSCRMTPNVVCASGSDNLDFALEVMTQQRFRHLPITEEGSLTGIVSIGDVVKEKIAGVQRSEKDLIQYISNSGYST